MMTKATVGYRAGMVGSLALLLVLAGCSGEASAADKDHQRRKPQKRLVGVSCVCYPPNRSIAETEQLIDAAALDKPDLVLLTEGCMHNTPPGASRQEKDARSDPLPEPGPITRFLMRKAAQHRTYISHFMSLTDSVKLHGKLWLDENDIRTWLLKGRVDLGWGQTGTYEETRGQLQREFANVLCQGVGQWWFDMGGGWYDDPRILSDIERMNGRCSTVMRASALPGVAT
jgi:hypothetical protein